jgi:hypothetical protein
MTGQVTFARSSQIRLFKKDQKLPILMGLLVFFLIKEREQSDNPRIKKSFPVAAFKNIL